MRAPSFQKEFGMLVRPTTEKPENCENRTSARRFGYLLVQNSSQKVQERRGLVPDTQNNCFCASFVDFWIPQEGLARPEFVMRRYRYRRRRRQMRLLAILVPLAID